MSTRAEAVASAVALPRGGAPAGDAEMGVPTSRVDPAKARQRKLPDPKPITSHGQIGRAHV